MTSCDIHLANGAPLEEINSFGNLRPCGVKASFGVTANYRYVPDELEENHERFVRGEIRVSSGLLRECKKIDVALQVDERSHGLPSSYQSIYTVQPAILVNNDVASDRYRSTT